MPNRRLTEYFEGFNSALAQSAREFFLAFEHSSHKLKQMRHFILSA